MKCISFEYIREPRSHTHFPLIFIYWYVFGHTPSFGFLINLKYYYNTLRNGEAMEYL